MSQTYRQLRKRLDDGNTSCREVVATAIDSIEKGRQLNAFLSSFQEDALKRADEIDQRLKNGSAGRLAGMTVAVKDNIAIKDHSLSCGSKILENFTSLYSATAIERLEREDAIILGKTNLDEFAMGSSNENSYFGPVKHPLDAERVPGGSSGGSAVAVAAEMTYGALGSETGGSVRQPAAFVGVVGLKPTYGRVSRYGLVAFASSLDQISPLARSVYDAALMLEVMAGADENDSTSSNESVGDYTSGLDSSDVRGLKIGVPKEYFIDGMDPAVEQALQTLREQLSEAGAEIVEISLEHTRYTIPCYYVIATAEASANLARFDGARYGYRSPEATTLEEMYEMSRSEGFGPEVKRRIMLGTFVLSSGYYDAYYRKAQQIRSLLYQDFEQAFSQVDLILAPTTPTPAFKLGEKVNDPLAMYLSDIFTAAANLSGNPAVSIPCGKDPATGLPVGAQLIARHFDEKRMLDAAAWIERANQ
jgi:aspartyl-tRNA(Asn)/glutamyl-tRNA(Gln) amidotransferase subunit A